MEFDLDFDFGNENKIVNNSDNNDLNLSNDFNSDFDKEEKTDKEELNNISQKNNDEIEDQFNPFDNEDNSDNINSIDNFNNTNIDSDINSNSDTDIQDNINIDDINESVMQIDDDTINSNSKVQSDIIKMDEEIDNINLFMKHMEKKGYQFESSRFLTKKFAESSDIDTIYNINITINNEVITAITGYDNNNKIITVPDAIIATVQNDIQESLNQII